MPLIPSHKNPINLLKAFRDQAVTRTSITNFDRKGKYRAIVDVLSDELISLREEQIAVTYANQISSASGQALDEIGDRLGVPRQKARHAVVHAEELSLAFYVESGTFGTINGGASIVIPSETLVFSDPNSNELNSTTQYKLGAIVLASSGTLQYVSAKAANLGSASNIGRTVIRQHNFTNYVDSANSSLKVVNFYPILNGSDEETDDQYRFRLANHYNKLISNNETRMKLSSLDIPGVANTLVEPGYFGIGTAAVFALGPEHQSNTQLLNALQERLNSWKTPGGVVLSTPATEVFFDFVVELFPSKPLTENQTLRLRTEVNRAFLQYFSTTPLGGVVNLDDLLQSVQTRISSVASFTQVGGSRIFKKVYIRKAFANGVPDEQARMVGSVYSLARDEFASLGTLEIEAI